MPKNIVLCCDGTGNQFGTELAKAPDGTRRFENNNSNVLRLYTSLKVGKEQVAYYHPGVGTMGSPTSRNRMERWWSKVKGLGFGLGFTDNIADAYRFLMENYADGDFIYLFGFSRGAYTVRALTGALSMYGLLCPGNEGHLNYLLSMYADASQEAYKRDKSVPRRLPVSHEATAFRQTFSRTVPIHFMGVWDTVSSVGWISDPVKLLHDGQNPIVRKARHAISIDERRCFFQAVPWGDPMSLDDPKLHAEDRDKLTLALKHDGWRMQDILQVWFPGVHSDVGGSYSLGEAGPALEAFKWMLEEARAPETEAQPLPGDGLLIHEDKAEAVLGRPSPEFYGIQIWNTPQPDIDNELHHSLHGPWWILEAFPHKYFDYAGERHWQLEPWPHSREIPQRSIMHPQVKRRLDLDATPNCPPAKRYKPRNLKPQELKPLDSTGVQTLHPKVGERLIEEKYWIYDPTDPRRPRASAKQLPGVVAAACVLVGAAAFVLGRRR